MLLGTYYEGVELHREEKIVFARFLTPHRVISTCRVGGGLRDDLECIYNHQGCEPKAHHWGMHRLATSDPAAYRQLVSGAHGLIADRCATLGTAANMNCLGIATDRYRDLEVIAACTGGVETNAGRVGDPASTYEWDGSFERLAGEASAPAQGTINTMVFINQELIPGAMVRTVMTATEAKTAVLQELAVNSRYSDGLATGTGTDQIAVACRLTGKTPLTWAGKHSKLGELIGRTVHDAIKQTLALQNDLTPLGQCSALVHIERLGADRQSMIEGVGILLSAEARQVFRANFASIDRDPLTVAAVAALVHLRDKLSWEVLPESCRPEILCSYGAQLCVAISGKVERWAEYRERLAMEPHGADSPSFLRLVYLAIATGFRDKWTWEEGSPPNHVPSLSHLDGQDQGIEAAVEQCPVEVES